MYLLWKFANHRPRPSGTFLWILVLFKASPRLLSATEDCFAPVISWCTSYSRKSWVCFALAFQHTKQGHKTRREWRCFPSLEAQPAFILLFVLISIAWVGTEQCLSKLSTESPSMTSIWIHMSIPEDLIQLKNWRSFWWSPRLTTLSESDSDVHSILSIFVVQSLQTEGTKTRAQDKRMFGRTTCEHKHGSRLPGRALSIPQCLPRSWQKQHMNGVISLHRKSAASEHKCVIFSSVIWQF